MKDTLLASGLMAVMALIALYPLMRAAFDAARVLRFVHPQERGMAKTFEAGTDRTLRSLGWIVVNGVATKPETTPIGVITRRVTSDATWQVLDGKRVIAEGTETHPAMAACDANNAFWAMRDAGWREEACKP